MSIRNVAWITAFVAASGAARATDYIVDATGAGGAFKTVSQAMAVCVPGDRILVKPGQYAPFHFSRGVHVIGLGALPSQVVFQRVDFHVTVPVTGYDALLSNVSITSTDPLDAIGLSGNELGAGTLVLDGVDIESGVFLNGHAPGFHLVVSNSTIAPLAGMGFNGAAVDVGGIGDFVDIVNSAVAGWSSSPANLSLASVGIRVSAGTFLKIDHSVVNGGNGLVAGAPYEAGAVAIQSGPGASPVTLRITGGSNIQGGNSTDTVPGPAAIAVQGNIQLSSANVAGGGGSSTGPAYLMSQPTALPFDLHLEITPAQQFGMTGTFVKPGDIVTWTLDVPPTPAGIVLSFGVVAPFGAFDLSLDPSTAVLIEGTAAVLPIPDIPSLTMQGLMLYAQGLVFDPGTSKILSTQVCSVRIDL